MKYQISKNQRVKADRDWQRAKQWLKAYQIRQGITETTTIKKLRDLG